MRIGSLFSGAGGLDMAVEEVFGGEVIWQAEVDKAASKVLAYRFPCAPNLGDITQIDWKTVEPVDVLCGGFPCQDVSAAGKRAGIKAGTRSGLWSVFADAIDQLRPPLVVIENVRGLLSAQAHRNVEPDEATVGDRSDGPVLRALGAVLGDLADLGYDAQWATVAASDVGAPHRRERVFIVAHSAEQFGSQRPWSDGGEQTVVSTGPGADRGDYAGDSSPRVQIVGRSTGSESSDAPTDGIALLPTPRATDPAGAQSRSSAGFRPQLGEVVRTLLPTPRNTDGERGPSLESGGLRLSGQPRQKDLNTVTVREMGLACDSGTEPVQVVVGEDDGAMPAFPGYDGGDDTGVIAFDGDGVAVNVGGGKQCHSSVVAPELAGTKWDLLPTPNDSDASGGGQHPDKRDGHSRQLIDYVLLLQTPQARDGKGLPGEGFNKGNLLSQVIEAGQTCSHPADARLITDLGISCGVCECALDVHDVARSYATQWGKYEPAIRRWESLTCPAPAPTEPNKNGNPRLSAAFSEWMMGWPHYWVTDPNIGISRNDQLKIVGNGVCPQQAAAALRYLLAVAKVAA